MIKNLIIIKSDSYDSYFNQALEASLLDYAKDCFVLYLWSNDNVVFIGKNQNAYVECNLDLLKKDNGNLNRRLSGGGAVYHDKGNINYTFISPKEDYNERQNFEIVLNALNSLGFNASLSGRNDLTILDKKFSGNAFYKTDKVCLHHGTLLINSEYERIGKYLSVSKVKLQAKGVESVRNRVINLSEVNEKITKEQIIDALINSTKNAYKGVDVLNYSPSDIDKDLHNKWIEYFSKKDWQLGDDIYYDIRFEYRYAWGTADIRLKVDKETIIKAKIYSDSLDTELIEKKENSLIGKNIYKFEVENV